MSTEIGNNERRTFTLDGNGGSAVQIIVGPDRLDRRTFDRDELIRGFASELDCIVIRRADLPQVRSAAGVMTVDGRYRVYTREYNDYPANRARETARDLLALAEYLDAHPPVDEAEVEALARALDDEWVDGMDALSAARRLVAAGWKR